MLHGTPAQALPRQKLVEVECWKSRSQCLRTGLPTLISRMLLLCSLSLEFWSDVADGSVPISDREAWPREEGLCWTPNSKSEALYQAAAGDVVWV